MLVAAGATWQRSGAGREEIDAGCPPARSDVVVGAGLGVGMLTGFFGVGGGFMIVPVLALGLGLAFRRAVATSLVIITLTGVVALTTHLLTGARPHFAVTAALASSTVVGALLGTAVADRLPQKLLARGFAVIVGAAGAVPAGRRDVARWAAEGLANVNGGWVGKRVRTAAATHEFLHSRAPTEPFGCRTRPDASF